MSYWFALVGAAVLTLCLLDLVWTTLSTAGGGPLSHMLGKAVWAGTRGATFAGPLVLVATAVLWVGLLWVGWSLVFMGTSDAVVSASTGAPADVGERFYFAGYTLLTLGLGDFVPSGWGWRAATVVATGSGLVFITLAVTYYTAVLGAAVQKQQLASSIQALGDSPAQIAANAWDGEGFHGIAPVLSSISSLISLHSRRHCAYPVLHFFRSSSPDAALSVQVARLGEALVLMRRLAASHRTRPVVIDVTERSLRSFLSTLAPGFVEPASSEPRLPDLGALRDAGLALDDLRGAFEDDEVRKYRRVLLGFVQQTRFRWSDVDPGSGPAEAGPSRSFERGPAGRGARRPAPSR